MKLYENKREIELSEALVRIFTNNVPGQNIEFMISFDEVTRVTRFGKCWTKKDTSRWGKLTPKYFVHEEYCPALGYDDRDIFLLVLFGQAGMKRYFGEKKFHIWEEI